MSEIWWIEPEKILGGPTPFPQAWFEKVDSKLIRRLQTLGVSLIINLQEEASECRGPEYFQAIKSNWKGKLPSIHQFSTADATPPSADHMLEIMALLKSHPGLTYIHCHAGRGRTGTVAGCWYRESGLGPQEAIDLVLARHAVVGNGLMAPDNYAQTQMIIEWGA